MKFKIKNRKVIIAAITICLLIAAGWFIFKNKDKTSSSNSDLSVYTVTRGDMVISIIEPGDIKAVNSTDIKSKVEGRTTIISIVDEGMIITAEDVNNQLVLAELDASEIERRLNEMEINYSNAKANFTEAEESLAIQKKQNESDVQAAKMEAEFDLMDFKKYLGREFADQVLDDVNDSNDISAILTSEILENEILGGEALQKLKDLSNQITLSESKVNKAAGELEWTKKLYAKEYVAETKLREDELELQSLEAQFEKNKIAMELFKLYEFPKQARRELSNYFESVRKLDRTLARARSQLAQKEAKLYNRKANYKLQKERFEKMQKQLEACVIKATVPGQVVYGSSLLDRWQRQNRPTKIGAEVRERQVIISIPDTSKMKIDIKVNENWISKIEPNLPAKISLSAIPDSTFEGVILKKAPMADPENWFNPDLKVYSTEVLINGCHEAIKTGMSAEVEIIIDHLKDVVYVPIQSVITVEGQKLCYVLGSKGTEKREIETGAFNTDFVEIKSGLTEGEKVLLNPPRIDEVGKENGKSSQPSKTPKKDTQK